MCFSSFLDLLFYYYLQPQSSTTLFFYLHIKTSNYKTWNLRQEQQQWQQEQQIKCSLALSRNHVTLYIHHSASYFVTFPFYFSSTKHYNLYSALPCSTDMNLIVPTSPCLQWMRSGNHSYARNPATYNTKGLVPIFRYCLQAKACIERINMKWTTTVLYQLNK